MDIYKKRSYWNIALAVFGLLILIVTLVYSNFLAQKLKEREKKNVDFYSEAIEEVLNNEDLNKELGIYDEIVKNNKLPVIVVDDKDQISLYNNFGREDLTDDVLRNKIDAFIKSGKKPIEGSGYANEVYYFDSPLVSYINYFPLIQLLLVGSFIALGYFFLVGSKRSEQNRVWAGMAKETAHQLGTPISAIIAWIEHLKMTDIDEEQSEIVNELRNDVTRLELVADRFSKIGSEPVLTAVNVYEEMDDCRKYMERRAPRKVSFNFPARTAGEHSVKINKHLFDWVIENLIRNSLDAMDGKGSISSTISADSNFVTIDITDTGKGIPSSKHKRVFEPGFSTKTRGWGLGLSLAKRIIENYHKGKIFVKASKPGEGTTFSIKLPKA